MFPILSIPVPFDPNIISTDVFVLSWHGFLSAVGAAVAVWMAGRAAVRDKLNKDLVYNTAVWGIVGGIIGARLVHVIDHWNFYSGDPALIFQVWSGGIGLWGGIIGGWIGGSIYGFISRQNVGKLMDIGAPSLLVGQTIGRVGDIINGEHCSSSTNLPWGWFFTDSNSPGRSCVENSENWSQGFFPPGTSAETAVHPVVVYEMVWNICGLLLITFLRRKLKPYGSIFFVYLAWYSVGRFFLQYLRLDAVKFAGFQEAHIIALITLTISTLFIAFKVRFGSLDYDVESNVVGRAERRRKLKESR